MCPESTLTAWRGLVFQQLGAEIRVPPGARAASRGGSGARGRGHSLPDRFLFIPHIQTKERGHRVSSPAEPDKRSSLTELRWLSVSALGAMKCKKDQLLMTTMVENSAWGGGEGNAASLDTCLFQSSPCELCTFAHNSLSGIISPGLISVKILLTMGLPRANFSHVWNMTPAGLLNSCGKPRAKGRVDFRVRQVAGGKGKLLHLPWVSWGKRGG